MDAAKLRTVLSAHGQPPFRLAQVLKAVCREGVSSYDGVTTLPAALRRVLEAEAPLMSAREERVLVSADGRARKAVVSLADGLKVETVLLKPKPGEPWSACISCQVGCAVGCTFCATGLMGLKRDLTPEEIVDQVLFWKQYLRREKVAGRLTNVVYMGMGEPFHCYEAVAESLRVLIDPGTMGLSPRNISVSTAGLAPGIERFGRDFPQVNLALSLHAADDELRSRLVPVNKAYPLARLAESLGAYADTTNRKIFLEYVLLRGENDGPGHADALARWVASVGRPKLLHVNLIVWNPNDTSHSPATAARARDFRDRLASAGLHVTIRRNLGVDIQGACGQLIA